MKSTAILIILGSVLLTACAQLALKVSSGRFVGHSPGDGMMTGLLQQFLHPLTVAAIAAYVVSLALWLLALRHLPLSIAFPFSGLTIAVVVLMSRLLLGETISVAQGAGIGLIVVGVVLLARTA